MLVGDAHVHVHRAFDLDRFFDAAAARANERGAPLLLLLSECAGDQAFRALHAQAWGASPEGPRAVRHRLHPTAEATSLAFAPTGGAEPAGFLIAGRQLISEEGIEVLALALEPSHALAEAPDRRADAAALVRAVLDAGAAAVLPWGLGKWLGRRGRRVAELASDPALRAEPLFLLGDTAHRFRPWRRPAPLRPPARVLAGSDILPVAGAERRVARYGFALDAPLDPDRPGLSFLEALRRGCVPRSVGRRESFAATLAEQLRFRRARRAARATA